MIPGRTLLGLTAAHYNVITAKLVLGGIIDSYEDELTAEAFSCASLRRLLDDAAGTGVHVTSADVVAHVHDVYARAAAAFPLVHPPSVARGASPVELVEKALSDWLDDPFDPVFEVWRAVDTHVRLLYVGQDLDVRPTRLRARWLAVGSSGGRETFDVSASTRLDAGDAEVTLHFHAGVMWKSVLALPYVLAHELMAHAHARTVLSEDENVFAEGWMDCLASLETTMALPRLPTELLKHSADIEGYSKRRHLARYERDYDNPRLVSARRRQGRSALGVLVNAAHRSPRLRGNMGLVRDLSLALNLLDVPGERLEALARNLASWQLRPDAHQADLSIVDVALHEQHARPDAATFLDTVCLAPRFI